MRKITVVAYLFLSIMTANLFANEVNIFSARHYDSDVQLYEKFTAKTGIKVNVVSGKSGALEKRIVEEGADSQSIKKLRQQKETMKCRMQEICFKKKICRLY